MSGTVGITRAQTRRLIALRIVLAGVLLACPFALALDPSSDINEYAHTAWKVREGFANGEIISIAQTPDGYLWLGTEFGLTRFDGVRNVPWQPPGDQHLPSNYIMSLLATRDGTLWIGTQNGLASWKDGKLKQYPELAGHYIFKILEDHEGTVWAGAASSSRGGGKLCAIRKGSVQCYGEGGALGRAVNGLYEDSKGNLWAGVETGLWRWKPGPPKFYPLAGEPDGIQALSEDTDGTLLVGWKGRIHRFVDGKTEVYSLAHIVGQPRIHRMVRDRDGGLWIATSNNGLMHICPGRTDVFAQADGLSGDQVDTVFEDREGTIWTGTIGGLDRFRDFTVATLTKNQGLSNMVVLSVLADRDGSVWINTRGGLDRWSDGQIKTYGLGGDKRTRKLDDAPTSLFQDDHGRVWVGTLRGVGYLEKGKFIPISGIPGGSVLSIVQGRRGYMWFANETLGLFRLSPRGEVQQIPWTAWGHNDQASVLTPDSQAGIWSGFVLGGIAYFTADGQIRASYTAADGLGAGRVSDLQFDNDGVLWVSTEGGLSRLKNNRVATLTSRNGLPCDTVHWAIEDDDHSMWLYTACGLLRIVRSELDAWSAAADKQDGAARKIQVTVFDSSDGVRSLASPGYYHPQVAKTPDGKLWFLPWDGVSVIDPRHLPFNNIPPPVRIEKVTADDKSYPLSNGIHLPAQIRYLDIDYTALSLVVAEKVRFRVKLEGQDKDWRELVNGRHVEYTNLPPKHYRFRVLACNNSGVWNEEGATLDFVIPPAWYQTNWFRSLCAVGFLTLLWGAYQLRAQQLQRQFNLGLEARVNERTRIARELHDTLLQSFQGLMLHFQTGIDLLPGRPAEARKTLEIAIDRADQAIAEGRDAVQGLRASTVETNDLASAVRILGEGLRAERTNQNSALFEMEVEGTPRNLHPILRDEVYRITGEALRNAFRHARAQRIEVEILYGERWLRLRVRDDGKGIDQELLSGDGLAGHYGLHGMRERAQLVGGKLAVWSKLDSGTEVELSIPASTAYAKPAGHRSWLSEKLSAKRIDFKETDVKETKTKS